MKTGFDINRITGDGYLILPLSMARLAAGFGQDPQAVYETCKYFSAKLTEHANDVVLLYTTGLYLHTPSGTASANRIRLNQQAVQHARELRNLIQSGKDFIPSAFHFLPFDYIILNSNYSDLFSMLQRQITINNDFKQTVIHDIKSDEVTQEQIHFILEELVVTHIIRQKLVQLPKTLVTTDQWRLISYPGSHLESDKYQHEHNLLPKQNGNRYSGGVYDYERKQFSNYDE